MGGIRYCAVAFVIAVASCGSASGFTLLDFPSDAEVQVGGRGKFAYAERFAIGYEGPGSRSC